jgi:hypothetical protein
VRNDVRDYLSTISATGCDALGDETGDLSRRGPFAAAVDTRERALEAAGAADVIELGNYVSRVATAPLVTPNRRGRPVRTRPAWPFMAKDGTSDVPGATFVASVARREEKGSHVNVADTSCST